MLSIAERHKYILDKLNKYGFVRITDVANELGVTKVTIRKDVKILESKGLLYKVHGSARPANPHVADLDVHVKDNINRDAKRLIAQRAVELLDDNDSIIIIASGSTIIQRPRKDQLPLFNHLNFLTSSLYLRENMCGQKYGTLLGNFFNQMPHLHDLVRVQPIRRLVQYYKLRVMHDRLCDSHTLLIPTR